MAAASGTLAAAPPTKPTSQRPASHKANGTMLERLSHSVTSSIDGVMYKLGHYAARQPRTVAACAVLAMLVLGCGMLIHFKYENQGDLIWCVASSTRRCASAGVWLPALVPLQYLCGGVRTCRNAAAVCACHALPCRSSPARTHTHAAHTTAAGATRPRSLSTCAYVVYAPTPRRPPQSSESVRNKFYVRDELEVHTSNAVVLVEVRGCAQAVAAG